MTVRQEPRSRTQLCNGIPATRRRSPCYRHPEHPITGICPSCLRERLYDLDVSVASGAELRRCKSVVSDTQCGTSYRNLYEPRRNSCDVTSTSNCLSELFGEESEPRVDSKNAGVSRLNCTAIESKIKKKDRVRGLDNWMEDSNCDGELKSMREFIDLEINNKTRKSKDLREMAANLVGASKKLLKWKKKNKEMKKTDNSIDCSGEKRNLKFFHYRQKLRESHSPIVGGRRSCDAGSTYSLDASRISLEQPRASWDGYMIARTIPRLAPMFSVVDNGILGNFTSLEKHGLSVDGTMHSIAEDKSSSGASGSSISNSDSSSSMRRSSFDRSTSIRSTGKKVMGYEDCGVSPANVKLVFTEKELKDWNMTSSRDYSSEKAKTISSKTSGTDGVINSGTSVKKPVPWHKLCKALRLRGKNNETFSGITLDHSMDHTGNINLKEAGRKCTINSYDAIEPIHGRRSVDGGMWICNEGKQDYGLKRNNSTNHSSSYIDSSFYATPLRNRKYSNYGKSKDYIARSNLPLTSS